MSGGKKYLIVGQGLAGSVLMHQLEKNNIPFKVIDDHQKKSASRAAGGIMHPMSFKRLILAWNALEFINYAIPFYQETERILDRSFFTPATFYKPFGSEEDRKNWTSRMNEPEFDQILGITNDQLEGIFSAFGIGTIAYSGRLEVNDFLNSTAEKFCDRINFEPFNHSVLLNENNGSWTYNEENYAGVIFCEGYQYTTNPYFSYLPNNMTKGEIIEISANNVTNKMISKGCFIVPQKNNGTYLVGSTYRWHTTSDEITVEAKEELIGKVSKVISVPFSVYKQTTGIRPTTNDRRPLVGEHPEYRGLYIFNGMGSKTVMMAPLMAEQFISLLSGENHILPEADISRHTKKHYSKSN
ncbi:MAG: FAD-dependent oxidoreductase [Flavobacteriales bacterium]|nr:FAD-dependent oxidoreductase [Flavobacteriales bacterium]